MWYEVLIRDEDGVKEKYTVEVESFKDIEKTLDKYTEYAYTIIKIKEASSCYGCRNKKGDQRSHMLPGGCLYDEDL
jgi:hypothetical protein